MSAQNYLIAVLPDRIQAEAAYTALEDAQVPLEQVSLLGRGYKSADEFGFINPNEPAQKQALGMIYVLVPFGFILGSTFHLATGAEMFPWAYPTVSHILGGLVGAFFGASGGFFVGGGVGLLVGGGDALLYRNRLDAGKYLIVVQGADTLTFKATDILRQFEIENIQGYVEPES
ncbi:MAG: hypothetical protein WA902_08360 [Thermosynechococcaceae cyanobacterium]